MTVLKRARCFFKAAAFFLSVTAGVLFILPAHSFPQAPFRQEFRENYIAMRHDYLSSLVRKNKFIIPGEVKAIVDEAAKGDKTFAERMELLDLASAMASMHKYWNGDERPLKLVEGAQREELKKEEARSAEAQRWARFERYTGNILMRSHAPEASATGKSPVIFPHWAHRLYYGCAYCHDSLFKMKRGAEDMTHKAMNGGRLCAACHDGKTAFGVKTDCERCHSAGEKSGERLMDSSRVDPSKAGETASRLGGRLDPAALKDKKLPHDRFSFIDWSALRKTGAYEPLRTSGKNNGPVVRDNAILIKPSMPGIFSVPFSHRTHTEETRCESCHPLIFKEELRGNAMNMTAFSEGRFCGACHGKAAFGFADCARCHSIKEGGTPKGEKGLIIRE